MAVDRLPQAYDLKFGVLGSRGKGGEDVGAEVKFEHSPGDLVDVPHLCIDGGLIKLAVVGMHGGKGYVVESCAMGKVFEVLVFEACVRPARVFDEEEVEQ